MITISTVGVPNTIKKLASHKLQSTLAVRCVITFWFYSCVVQLLKWSFIQISLEYFYFTQLSYPKHIMKCSVLIL